MDAEPASSSARPADVGLRRAMGVIGAMWSSETSFIGSGWLFGALYAAQAAIQSVFSALPTAGVVFALLGFEQADQLAGEIKNPQKNLPRAVIGAIIIAVLIYVLLQVVFIGATPHHLVAANGWAGLPATNPIVVGPFAGLAGVVGLGRAGHCGVVPRAAARWAGVRDSRGRWAGGHVRPRSHGRTGPDSATGHPARGPAGPRPRPSPQPDPLGRAQRGKPRVMLTVRANPAWDETDRVDELRPGPGQRPGEASPGKRSRSGFRDGCATSQHR